MIRRGATALLAVLLALAAGIALGAGPLSAAGSPADREAAGPTPTASPSASTGRNFGDEVLASGASRLYADGLAGEQVILIALPGASADVLAALSAQIEAAGGAVVGTARLADGAVDPGGASLVDSLGSQLAAQVRTVTIDEGASSYPRLGALLGATLAGPVPEKRRERREADAATILESLSVAGLATVEPSTPSPADLVLVVLGQDAGEDADPLVGGLLDGLASAGAPLVVAGATEAADLARLRAGGEHSSYATVDGDDTITGQTTVILALIRSLSVAGGDFGASGADGPVPLG